MQGADHEDMPAAYQDKIKREKTYNDRIVV